MVMIHVAVAILLARMIIVISVAVAGRCVVSASRAVIRILPPRPSHTVSCLQLSMPPTSVSIIFISFIIFIISATVATPMLPVLPLSRITIHPQISPRCKYVFLPSTFTPLRRHSHRTTPVCLCTHLWPLTPRCACAPTFGLSGQHLTWARDNIIHTPSPPPLPCTVVGALSIFLPSMLRLLTTVTPPPPPPLVFVIYLRGLVRYWHGQETRRGLGYCATARLPRPYWQL